ncbi:hypothetical protein RvY_11166-2 [Ramazzottius varieornatus]|uniref:PAS domain-containing protein n=1 Tax=Ramazzottius varieornatus TaxID=947166 RepID=A0A1D1VHN2_RAMVA|nr:hypothetical protein RvY_11166-2 [Ramazzottius varieornatus]
MDDLKQVEPVRLKLPYSKITGGKARWNNGHRKTALCIRFRSTLTKRGVQMRYSGYRVLSLQVQSRYSSDESEQDGLSRYDKLERSNCGQERLKLGYVVFATALPSLNINELRLDSLSVTTKMTLDLKIMSCDLRLEALTGCPQDLLIGTSFYSLCYGRDFEAVRDLHDDVLRKGQSLSSYYRLMNHNGGFSWVQTGAHLMTASKAPGEQQCIVAVHSFIREAEPQQGPLFLLPYVVAPSSHLGADKKPRSDGFIHFNQVMEEKQPPSSKLSQTARWESGDLQMTALPPLQLDETSPFLKNLCQRQNNGKKKNKSEKSQLNAHCQEAVTGAVKKSSKRRQSKEPHSVRKKTK